MGMIVSFSPELRTWILHNLDRGCAVADLVARMVDQKFEPGIARELVETFVHARAAGIDPPAAAVTLELAAAQYHYEMPRIAPGTRIHTSDREISVLLRLEQPVLVVLEDVLSPDECDLLIEQSRSRLQPSTVVDLETGDNKVAAHRNSRGMFFRLEETPFIARLDRRVSEIMNCPVENGEGLQVLHYGTGAQSAPHFDFLVPSNLTNAESLARSGQRISSLVVYLNDVSAGGETFFPEIGLAVSPKKGSAVYFEYANSRRQLDHKSLHAGAVIAKGEKWAVTKWMRERRFISA
jgi:prolyl 4-hydroxylase